MTREEVIKEIKRLENIRLNQETEAYRAKIQRDAFISSFLPDGNLVFQLFWKCQLSPIGYCVYNEEEDPAHDSCIYCCQPYERK